MRLICAVLLVLVLAFSSFGDARRVWVFRGEPGDDLIGYVVLDGKPYAHGWLYVGTWTVRLAGLAYRGWFPPNDMKIVAVIGPVQPWICGLLFWDGLRGTLDFFSTDGVRNEYLVTVTELAS